MALKLLVLPDKFKGTLTAPQAADAITRGWRRARPDDRIEPLPMSDGGDGFGDVMRHLLHARPRKLRTRDAAHRPCQTEWHWNGQNRTAIIESARIIGLSMLPPGKYHPFDLDTFGLGAAITAAIQAGAQRCLIGIGGSATNDAGFGMARALGWKFLDADDRLIERWTELERLQRLVPPESGRPPGRMRVQVAVDVRNPLLGPNGCSRVYGPQKGLRPDDFPRAEAALSRLAAVVKRELKQDHARRPGAGAAGGLGFGLMTFLNAEPIPGFALFARHANLEQKLRKAGLVITGEGAIDRSSVMGKGVGEIARLCKKHGVHCIALGGMIDDPRVTRRHFAALHGLTDLTSSKNARRRPEYWLERLAWTTARQWSETNPA
ncbi:MAG TPA: glycerate kinase [Methylomirabilota bacterium]|nr:glycerate kinase [Methylomirabilota bacterium]